jgi:hypothetical protein
MTITNGYCTLAEAKERISKVLTYTATTISFTTTTNVITDTRYGLKLFKTGDIITVSGSTSNDGTYTIDTGNTAGTITVSESLTTEAAGDTVTIQQIQSLASAASPVHDTMIEQMVMAASRWIDEYTGLTFYSSSTTRYYIVGIDTEGPVLYLDMPLLTVTTLTNGDSVEIGSGDYTLLPKNEGHYWKIRLDTDSGKTWQYTTDQYADTISVAGTWGYASTAPVNIKEACLLLVNRLYARRNAVFGVQGTTELGVVSMRIPQDPDVMALLTPYRKLM